MKVSFLNFKKESKKLIKMGLMKDIENVIKSGIYLFGSKTEELEYLLSKRLNHNVVLVGSGTDALALSLLSLGIKSKMKIGIPSYSAIPTAIAVKMIGAIPVYIDINKTATIDYKNNLQLDAIIPVHLYGNIAKTNFNIPVIEDCAQSFGIQNGFSGFTKALSFYPTKNLGAFGDGGAIVVKTKKHAELIKQLRFYGQNSKSSIITPGLNSRMDEIQVTILLKKLQYFDEMVEKRQEMFYQYKPLERFSIKWKNGAVPHIYPLLSKQREKTIQKINQCGIETALHYPFYLQKAIENIENKESYAYKLSQQVFSIPFNPFMKKKEIKYVINKVLDIMEKE